MPKPDECPLCGQSYAFRVRSRLDEQMNLKTHFRCGTAGGWVYAHEIELDLGGFGAAGGERV